MRVLSVSFLLFAIGVVAAGCATPINGVSSHTLKVGPDQEADVVWVRRNGEDLYRCALAQNGPICVQATWQ